MSGQSAASSSQQIFCATKCTIFTTMSRKDPIAAKSTKPARKIVSFFSVKPLCPTANFCTVRGVLWIPIRNKRGVQILLLAVAGISGCSSAARPYHSATVSPSPVGTVRELTVIADPAPSNAPTTPQIDIAIADAGETIAVPPMPRPQPAPLAPSAELKNHRVGQLEKTAPTISSAANPIVTARPAENDNRLLEFLDKDIDKAIEQPKERRHLHFSKAVVDQSARAPVRPPVFSHQQSLFRDSAGAVR